MAQLRRRRPDTLFKSQRAKSRARLLEVFRLVVVVPRVPLFELLIQRWNELFRREPRLSSLGWCRGRTSAKQDDGERRRTDARRFERECVSRLQLRSLFELLARGVRRMLRWAERRTNGVDVANSHAHYRAAALELATAQQ